MLIGIVLMLGVATWVACHIKFQIDGYNIGLHVHGEERDGE